MHSYGHIHDLLTIGFGPAGLSIAVAAHEKRLNSFLALEKQSEFKWHPGMLIPGASMQISFLKDLATLRDPKSEFTFLNYLFEHDRMLKFLNLNTFLPEREEYQNYMKWAAKKIEAGGTVRYSTSVKSFEPTSDPKILKVIAEGPEGQSIHYTRNLIMCTGGQPHLPESFPRHPLVYHSSQFVEVLPKMQKRALRHGICVIGSGQSSAEIWTHLTKVYPEHKIDLKFRSSALKPSDDSPFVNEIFDPASRIDEWYKMDPIARKALIQESRATNYSVVRLTLLEQMYHHLYTQELPGHEKHHVLTPNSVIQGWQTNEDSVTLHVRNTATGRETSETFDHVFCATGYQRTFHTSLLSRFDDVLWLESIPVEDPDRQPIVDRLYRVSRIDGDEKAGIYLQGLCESSHGLSDTLLSVLATRGMEVVQDIQTRCNLVPTPPRKPHAVVESRRSLEASDYGSDGTSSPDCLQVPLSLIEVDLYDHKTSAQHTVKDSDEIA